MLTIHLIIIFLSLFTSGQEIAQSSTPAKVETTTPLLTSTSSSLVETPGNNVLDTPTPTLSSPIVTNTESLTASTPTGSFITESVTSSSRSSSNGTVTSSSDEETATDAADLEQVDPAEGKESTIEVPPRRLTPQEWIAEQKSNLPEVQLSDEEAKKVAVLETVFFENFANNAPAPIDVGRLTIPQNVSTCSVAMAKRGLLPFDSHHERDISGHSFLNVRSLVGFDRCKIVGNLDVTLWFHYVRESKGADKPYKLAQRMINQFALLNKVFNPISINFNYGGDTSWSPVGSQNWSILTEYEDRLQKWQKKSHVTGRMTLNVWLINELVDVDGGEGLYGYAKFPQDKAGKLDGVVIEQKQIGDGEGEGSPLIHEIGHWMGLYHTFNGMVPNEAEDCISSKELLRREQTRGWEQVIFNCEQEVCAGGGSKEIYNYMSYSECQGKVPELGFSTAQKSAIFARTLEFRSGYRDGECRADSPKQTKIKRSSMQDMIDGKCPDIKAQVEGIKDQKTSPAKSSANRMAKVSSWLTGNSMLLASVLYFL